MALTLVDHLRLVQERFDQVLAAAQNDRRPPQSSDGILDDVHELGTILCRLSRGGGRR